VTDFEIALNKLFQIEGGFSNNAKDAGGKTMYGITEAVARANGYRGRMEDLSPAEAARIFKSQYWDTLRLDEIARQSYPIAYELFDTGVNCGIGTAGGFLQRALNALNREGADYADLIADGVVGPITVSTLKRFLTLHVANGEKVMLRALNSLQGAYYIDISTTRPANERFEFGWFLNRMEIA
jgi:lysozyme family protein